MKEQVLDKELSAYLSSNRIEIEDNGFTESVMKRLPPAPKYGFLIYVFLFIGLLAALFTPGYEILVSQLYSFMSSLISFKIPSVEAIIITVAVILGALLLFNITYDEGLV